MDPHLRGDDEFFFGCHSDESRNPGLCKETWVKRPTLIIIPILNGDIASSIPSRTEYATAESRVIANVVTAVASTVRRTSGSRAVCVVEHPSRTNRACYATPTFDSFGSRFNIVLVSGIWFAIPTARYIVTRCYTRYGIVWKCHRPCSVCIMCAICSRHRRIQDNGRMI